MSDTNDPGKPTPPEAPVPPVPPTPPAPPTQPEPPRFDDADAQPTTATPQAGGDQQPTTAAPQAGGDQQPTSVLPGFDGSPYDGGQQNTFQQNADQQPTTALPQSQAPQFNAAPPAPPVPPVPPQQAPGQGYPAYSAAPREPKGLAITAMILGIVAVVGALIFGWLPFVGGIITILVGAAAVVLGIIALRKKQSKGMSLTGLITGGVGVLIGIGIVITWAAVFSSVGSELDSYSDSLDELQSEIESPSSDSSDSDALTEDLEASAEPTTPDTEEAPADTTGDRSPEFCAALDRVATVGGDMASTDISPEIIDAYRQLAEADSPNQAIYEKFYQLANDPASAMNEDLNGLMEEYVDAAMEDAMACM